MATINSVWTEDQALTFDDATPAKETEGKANVDLANSGFIGILLQLAVTFGATADGNAEIRLYGSPDSGTTMDTIPLFSQEIEYAAGETKRLSATIMHQPYVQVGVYNGNAVAEDITISGKCAGMKYASV